MVNDEGSAGLKWEGAYTLNAMAVSLWEVAYISAEVKVPLTPKN